MKRILRGLEQFRNDREAVKPTLQQAVNEGQHPEALLITCADSRVVMEMLFHAAPGDLLIIRNIGNLVPEIDNEFHAPDATVEAAVDYALEHLGLRDIIVMGHSDCGAMKAALAGEGTWAVKEWLRHAEWTEELESPALDRPIHDQLSQSNVVAQLRHLAEYPTVKARLATGEVSLHGWWFCLEEARVHVYEPSERCFHSLSQSPLFRQFITL